jgi:hypothetical protein
MLRRLDKILVGLICVLLGYTAATAQTAIQVTLGSPQTDDFPRITAYLAVQDGQGNPVPNLRAQDVTLLENGLSIRLDSLRLLNPGVQFALAINPGPSLAIRDGQGISRYDYLVEALTAWAERLQGAEGDDLSLVTPGGAEAIHLTEAAEWKAALEAYQPDLRSATPSLDLLARALDVAADPAPRPGMGRAVLFVTPYLEQDVIAGLSSLAARAGQLGIRVFVWMVSSPELFNQLAGGELASLAASSGGRFFGFSGSEPIPDPETYLEALRSVYLVAYTSQIQTSGAHTVSVTVQEGEEEAQSADQLFELQLSPPNPVFVSPSPVITRSDPIQGQAGGDSLQPQQHVLEVLVEFPDGYIRPIQQLTLYVDGERAAQRLSPPFDRVSWDLTEYTSGGRHLLQLEVTDSLGLIGVSTELPVQVTVQRPSQGVLTTISRNGPLLVGAALVMAAAVLVLVLIVGGRIRPRPGFRPGLRRRQVADPITRPVAAARPTQPIPTRRRFARWTAQLPRRLPWPQGRPAAHPLAQLVWHSDREPPTTATPIPITASEITLGSDPQLSTVVLEDASVEKLHARLQHRADGSFYLADQGSVAGTWVNYAPISDGWVRLEDGDLIHVGRVGFSFALKQTGGARRPKVTAMERKP